MNRRVAAVWAVAVGGSVALGALALQPPAGHHPPSLSSGPLFAVRPGVPIVSTNRRAVTPVTITLSDKGCQVSPATFGAGAITFTVLNPGKTVVNEAEFRNASGEQILGEAESVDTPGQRESFSLVIAAGTYQVSCPGTGAPSTKVIVTS